MHAQRRRPRAAPDGGRRNRPTARADGRGRPGPRATRSATARIPDRQRRKPARDQPLTAVPQTPPPRWPGPEPDLPHRAPDAANGRGADRPCQGSSGENLRRDGTERHRSKGRTPHETGRPPVGLSTRQVARGHGALGVALKSHAPVSRAAIAKTRRDEGDRCDSESHQPSQLPPDDGIAYDPRRRHGPAGRPGCALRCGHRDRAGLGDQHRLLATRPRTHRCRLARHPPEHTAA